MRWIRGIACFLLFAVPGLSQPMRLASGVPNRFTIPPQTRPSFLTGFAVAVPPGSTRLVIDLEPDVVSHDLSLLARFESDFVVQGGSVDGRDFFAQTLGNGRVQIVVNSSSSPPLETGIYYVAIGVLTLNTAIGGTLTATVEAGAELRTLITSTFDFDTDQWTRNYPGTGLLTDTVGDELAILRWVNTGGLPGGYLELLDNKNSPFLRDFVVAPRKFLGNYAALANPRIDFDYRNTAGTAVQTLLVRIIANGTTFEWTSPEPPPNFWKHYSIPVSKLKTPGQSVDMAFALSEVRRIEVSMDQSPGVVPEANAIDNFTLMADPVQPRPATVPNVPVRSTFEFDTESWSRDYPAAGLPGAALGDSGSSISWVRDSVDAHRGSLIYTEPGGGGEDFFVAPANFLGNLSVIPNLMLEFDYRHMAQNSPPGPMVVRLLGAGAAFRWIGPKPAALGQIRHYQVPLASGFFVRESGAASFSQVLADVDRLEISADLAAGPETDILSNVELHSVAALPPQPTLALSSSALTFSATVNGPDPAQQTLTISSSADGSSGGLTWTAAVDPVSPWLQVSAADGATPAKLDLAPRIANLAPGTYSTTVTINGIGAANGPLAVKVTLTVAPILPRINPGGIRHAATFQTTLAPGCLATLFGTNLGPTLGTSIGFLPGTQKLPTRSNGLRVLVEQANGDVIAEAPLLYASERQLNFQIPFEAVGRSAIAVVVDNNGAVSAPETVPLASVAPGMFFTQEFNRAVVQNQDYTLNSSGNPASRGSVILAYLTGQGLTSPPVPSGQAAPVEPLAVVKAAVTATIGGTPATVLFLGLTPGLIGVAQANILVPDQAPIGDRTLLITVDGQATNDAFVSIQ